MLICSFVSGMDFMYHLKMCVKKRRKVTIYFNVLPTSIFSAENQHSMCTCVQCRTDEKNAH